MYIGGVDYDNILLSSTVLHFRTTKRYRRAAGGGLEYERCFDVSIFPDLIVESNETFSLHLNTSDPSVEFQPENATVVIQDNDGIVYILLYLYNYSTVTSLQSVSD